MHTIICQSILVLVSVLVGIILLVTDSSKKTLVGKKEERDMGVMTCCVGCGTLDTLDK